MLRIRICPQCQEEIYSLKSYFCHRCGAELPAPSEIDLLEADRPVEALEAQVVSAPEVKSRKPLLAAAVVTAVVLITAAGAGAYYLLTRSAKPLVPTTPANEAFVPETVFPIENHPLSAKGLSEIVPADIDLYLESDQPEEILPTLLSSEDWSRLLSALIDQIGLTATESASFLEEEFAVIAQASSSAFLARVKDLDFLQGKVVELGVIEGWQVKLLQGYLVVYDSEEILTAIDGAMKKLVLNLSLVADFVEARKRLPSSGQIFYYGTKRPEFVPGSLKGNAFVISKKGEGTLITGL